MRPSTRAPRFAPRGIRGRRTREAEGRLAAADSLLRDALTLRRAHLTPTNPEIGVTLFALARCRAGLDRVSEVTSRVEPSA
jgi:hypothetical protein